MAFSLTDIPFHFHIILICSPRFVLPVSRWKKVTLLFVCSFCYRAELPHPYLQYERALILPRSLSPLSLPLSVSSAVSLVLVLRFTLAMFEKRLFSQNYIWTLSAKILCKARNFRLFIKEYIIKYMRFVYLCAIGSVLSQFFAQLPSALSLSLAQSKQLRCRCLSYGTLRCAV